VKPYSHRPVFVGLRPCAAAPCALVCIGVMVWINPRFAKATQPTLLDGQSSTSDAQTNLPVDQTHQNSADATTGNPASTATGRPPSSDFSAATADILAVEAYSSTYATLFQRALLPGPAGSRVGVQTELPVYEYGLIRVVDADAPWLKNSLDMELSLWASSRATDNSDERLFDGDISVASITHRVGRGYVKLGRQYVTEGAARFSHLDGVSAGIRTEPGVALSGYAGWTVLPRWDDLPNYSHFGSPAEALVESPDDLPSSNRGGYWMGGARVGYSQRAGEVGLSFHEQREHSALGRRDVALDLHIDGSQAVDGNARALMDVDSRGLADAFVGLGLHPVRELDVAVEYRRMTPTLLMSRQSVLSVFAVERFDEAGSELRWHATPGVVLFGGGFVEWFRNDGSGYRSRMGTKISPDRGHRLLLQIEYSRVLEPNNGYHGSRFSIAYRVSNPITVTAEQYAYLYDAPISGFDASTVHALTAAYHPNQHIGLMLGGSVFHSPYAALDAEVLTRFSYAFGHPLGGEP